MALLAARVQRYTCRRKQIEAADFTSGLLQALWASIYRSLVCLKAMSTQRIAVMPGMIGLLSSCMKLTTLQLSGSKLAVSEPCPRSLFEGPALTDSPLESLLRYGPASHVKPRGSKHPQQTYEFPNTIPKMALGALCHEDLVLVPSGGVSRKLKLKKPGRKIRPKSVTTRYLDPLGRMPTFTKQKTGAAPVRPQPALASASVFHWEVESFPKVKV